MGTFKKATKAQAKLRVSIFGPSGSGKTYTALLLGAALGGPVALIDTERGSASKYAGDVADFDALELTSYEPAKYIRAIGEAAKERYPVLVIDSLSHAWSGKGGILEQKDAKGGRFDAWKELTPQQTDLLEAILAYPGHVIVTMRSKTEYVIDQVENRAGKLVSTPRKVGLAPVQRQDLEYEFDVVLRLDADNVAHVEKTRCSALAGLSIRHPGAPLADLLTAWLSDGAPPVAPRQAPAQQAPRRTLAAASPASSAETLPAPPESAEVVCSPPSERADDTEAQNIARLAELATAGELAAFAADVPAAEKTPRLRAAFTARLAAVRGAQ